MLSSGEKKLFLVDAYALIYRAYFAFAKNPRITSRGFDTSAIYGFTNMLLELINNESPTHLGIVFDTPKKTHRHIEYVDYKANRDAMPEGISTAIPYIKQILKAFNIPVLSLDGYEADDVIGTLAKQAENLSFNTYMMTPDKDFAQLVSQNTFMYRPGSRGNPHEIWDVNTVCEKFNIQNVTQVVDFLGMVGDSVDNIPGIAGVGPKTASRLINEYGSIEALYECTDNLQGKLKEKVVNGKEKALLSKSLAKIIIDAPIKLDLEELRVSDPNLIDLKQIFDELEFARIYQRISKKFSDVKPKQIPSSYGGQLDMFSVDPQLTDSIIQKGIKINNKSELKNLLEVLLTKNILSFFLLQEQQKPIGFSIAGDNNYSAYIIFNNNLTLSQTFLELSPLLKRKETLKILYNAKIFKKQLNHLNIPLQGDFFDVSIAEYLLNPDSNHTFFSVLQKYDCETINLELLDLSNQNDIAAYLINASMGLFEIKNQVEKLLQNYKLIDLFYSIELPLVDVLLHMEINGIRLDAKLLEYYSGVLNDELLRLTNSIYKEAGQNFNISSPKQLGFILFEKMRLSEKPKKTKSGQFSTSESELIKLKGRHKIVDYVLLFRTCQKLLSTYVNALPLLMNNETKKIHTTFNQSIAATGRLTSSNPNLQNIPIRRSSGKDVRKAFVPSDSQHILMSADYSQIELRLIAELSQSDNMIEAFLNNEDIHASTAAKVFKVDINNVTSEMRSNAKTVNFGIIYGVSAFGLSEQTSLNRQESAVLIDTYFKTYPKLKLFIENQIEFARKHGYVQTIFGRRRELRNINSRNAFIRGHDERNAVNMPIQGSAADIIKLAMIKIHNQFQQKGLLSKMVLQVHDELVFDVYKPEKELVKLIVKEGMEEVHNTKVPLIVDIGFGDNWLEAH